VQGETESCPARPSLAWREEDLRDGSGLYLLAIALPTMPALITSGKTDAESVRLAISKGAQGYLRKPFNLADRRSAVEAAFRQRADSAA
jgi:DNA-binding NtrC family response regulator